MTSAKTLQTVYLSLGSNIEPRLERLGACCDSLDSTDGITLKKSSRVYQSKAEGMAPDSADFLNQVVCIETDLEAQELLLKVELIEREMGRSSKGLLESRTIDIDILLFAEEKIDSETLTVPHPRMSQRAFVMIPLLELDNTLKNPNNGQPFAELVSKETSNKLTSFNEADVQVV